ncbi:LacI family DNA-binding transcriptional regulator [Billgrantia antri]|uniref:LacI family DNA-binding transcriptional regulator n=1 Tax=Halomonas sulfidivorans TaxID=2733488 RepID=A0ABX7WBQ9_9GAMM|nr:LacI family DNA-binding transcriptional regulator [Halomonas sulfidivorans]QTP57559.1 LacI family DNA-binding transcriptional regulator [Halomonas sulfidivorans]
MPAPTSRHPTILEVAREAGASKTSVSRYFGGERERLSPALRQRIGEAAHKLGYRPNQIARGLKGGRSRLLGMLVADIRNPYSVAVMHGVEQACREQGYSLLVANTGNDPAQERTHLSLLASYRVEGLMINAAGQPTRELQAMAEQGLPLVLVDRWLEELEADRVGLDNALAVDMAIDHLSAQGYRHLLFLSEPVGLASPRQQRWQRFEQRLSEEPALDGERHDPALDGSAVGALLEAFLARAGRPAAVLCANGNVTLAATRALQALGIRLGEVGLLGIDELDWCSLVPPGITNLAQPTETIGRAAVQQLLARLDDGGAALPPRHTLFSPTLIARGSTRLPITDNDTETP